MHPRDDHARYPKGFTLVELLVTVSILVVITAIILVSQNRFGGQITLTNLAYSLALSIRQAQTYGLAVREVNSGSGNFSAAFGVHFDPATPSQYIIFADLDGNGRYTDSSENYSFIRITSGGKISSVCGVLANATNKCNPDISTLDIVFKRPNPDALIKSNVLTDTYGGAKIVLTSPQGDTRYVYVAATGQISVQQAATTLYTQASYYAQGYYQSSYYSQSYYQSTYYSQGYYQSYYESSYQPGYAF